MKISTFLVKNKEANLKDSEILLWIGMIAPCPVIALSRS